MGLELAGYGPDHLFEIDPWCCATLRLNGCQGKKYLSGSVHDVDVEKVRVMNYSPKFGRWGRKRIQRKSAYKKAIVTLLPGQQIDAFEGV